MSKKKPYTPSEIAWAMREFTRGKVAGTLKPARGLIAVGFSDGTIVSRTSAVTYRDYLKDARRVLDAGSQPRRRK